MAVVSAGKAGRCAGQASVGNSSYATDSFAIHIITFGVSGVRGVSEPARYGKLPEYVMQAQVWADLDYNTRLLKRLLDMNFQFPTRLIVHQVF